MIFVLQKDFMMIKQDAIEDFKFSWINFSVNLMASTMWFRKVVCEFFGSACT